MSVLTDRVFRAEATPALWDETKEKVMGAVKKKFPPELINRLDDLLVFTPIGRADLINIVDLLIHNVQTRLKEAQQVRFGLPGYMIDIPYLSISHRGRRRSNHSRSRS
jgi:ATP-dependent Clp protease ATP-binding subunit ClpA